MAEWSRRRTRHSRVVPCPAWLSKESCSWPAPRRVPGRGPTLCRLALNPWHSAARHSVVPKRCPCDRPRHRPGDQDCQPPAARSFSRTLAWRQLSGPSRLRTIRAKQSRWPALGEVYWFALSQDSFSTEEWNYFWSFNFLSDRLSVKKLSDKKWFITNFSGPHMKPTDALVALANALHGACPEWRGLKALRRAVLFNPRRSQGRTR